MPDPNETNFVSERRSFSAPPAEVARRSSVADSLNLADASETKATNQLTFHDLLDAINPLQHIPVVSWIYRAVSGDTISAQARIVGDGIYGGIFGVVSGMFNALVEKDTGEDVGAHVMALFGGKSATPATTNVAAAAPASTAAVSTASAAATPTASAAATSTASVATAPTASATATPVTAAGNTPAIAGSQPAAQPLSTDSQTALAKLAADLHATSPSGVTPASFFAGTGAAVPTSANGTPLPSKPVLAARAGGNNGAPTGMGLDQYRRWPVATATVAPQPAPPLAGVGTSQAAASYAQALELSKQLQNYYQAPDGTQPPGAAAPAPAVAAP
jgi:hypothetical protein